MSLAEEFLGDQDEEENNIRLVSGITTGIVKENWDEKFPGMVKVDIFLGEEGKNLTDWVRVMSPYAGKDYGSYMLPEIGDEVVIAFNFGDTNRPYVLGSVWNKNQKIPDKTADKDNSVKRIKTKGGHEIIFQEEKGKERIEIHTPKELMITLEDEKELISIKDKDGTNLITLDCKGGEITVKAKSAITLDAGGAASLKLEATGGKVTLKGTSIAIEGQKDATVKGATMTVQGTSVSVKADADLGVKSSGMLTLKGSLTKIN